MSGPPTKSKDEHKTDFMELNIVDATSDSVCSAFGISKERMAYLTKRSNEILASYGGHNARITDILNEIAFYCETKEELVVLAMRYQNALDRRAILIGRSF